MAIRILLAGLIAGLLFFGWEGAAHMALPLGDMGMSELPDEDSMLSTMSATIEEPGLYFFPGGGMGHDPGSEEWRAFEAKMRDGPSGILVYRPRGAEAMSSQQFLREVAFDVLACLLAAFLASRVGTGFSGRAVAVALLGPIAWLSVNASYWNWFGFPRDFVVAEFITQAVGWIVAGLVIAAIVRPARAAVPAQEDAGAIPLA